MIHGILTSLSGMTQALRRTNVAAHNIANSQTDGFKSVRAKSPDDSNLSPAELSLPADGAEVLPPSDVDLTTEVTNILINKNAFQANIAAIKVQDEALGDILDITE